MHRTHLIQLSQYAKHWYYTNITINPHTNVSINLSPQINNNITSGDIKVNVSVNVSGSSASANASSESTSEGGNAVSSGGSGGGLQTNITINTTDIIQAQHVIVTPNGGTIEKTGYDITLSSLRATHLCYTIDKTEPLCTSGVPMVL